MQSESPEIILASASGARAAILASAGVRFRQQPSMLDEIEEQKHLKPGTPPDEVARTLARLKADDVLKAEPNAIVIGADQVLAIGSEIVQKPKSQEQARAQLRKLRGRTHTLHCAAVIVHKGGAVTLSDAATLTMRNFSEGFLDWYLETAGEAVLTSVGAYHIEGLGIHLFSEVKGDYYTILGLPILPVLEELRRLSVLMK
ncbi:MAG TPA: Maf family protein [Hyphomicrobiales bacterium]|nr:Maf family protein [Hyphomicrobiales bacterium]